MDNEHFIPVNSTAKKVIQKGIHYEYIVVNAFHQENPHRIRLEKSKILEATKNPSYIDFTGHKHGKFTVIKFVGKGKWSCRCECGNYEVRTARAFKNHIKYKDKFDIDMCYSCQDLKRLRNKSSALSQGYDYKNYMEKTAPRRQKLRELKLNNI